MEARGLLVDHDEDFFPDIEAMALSYEGNNESKHLPVNQPVSSHRKAIVSLSLEEYGKIVKRRLPPINPRMQWSDFPRPQPPPQPQLPSKMPGPIQTAPHPDINKPSHAKVIPSSPPELTGKMLVIFEDLAASVTEEDMNELCSVYGELISCKLVKAENSSTISAMVEFEDRGDAERAARNYLNRSFKGRELLCHISAEKEAVLPEHLPREYSTLQRESCNVPKEYGAAPKEISVLVAITQRNRPLLPLPYPVFRQPNPFFQQHHHGFPPIKSPRKESTRCKSAMDLDKELEDYRKKA